MHCWQKYRIWTLAGVVGVIAVCLTLAVSGQNSSTITVCASNCDFSRISDAIAAANNGALINVGSGVFLDSALVITKSLTLQGQGIDKTYVRNAEPANTFIQVESASVIEVVISNLTLDARDTASQNCLGDGLQILDQARVKVTDALVANHGGTGLSAHDSAQALIENSTIARNGHDCGEGSTLQDHGRGLLVTDSAQVVFSASTVDGNGSGVEIQAGAGAKLSMNNSTITNNGSGVQVTVDGASAVERVDLELSYVRIGNNGGDGVVGRGAVTIRNSDVQFNGGSAVVYFGGNRLIVYQTSITHNSESGIILNCEFASMCASINENEISRNGQFGLNADSSMILECKLNFIHDNAQDFLTDALAQQCSS